jgi:peptidoglycan pentaglycine glycine transferase (the first glycine)
MIKWSILSEDESRDEWDEVLRQASDATVFQSYAWGVAKSFEGWTTLRLSAKNDRHETVSVAQVLIKTVFPGVKLGWVPGGPVLGFSGFQYKKIPEILQGLVDKLKSLGTISLRFDSYLARNTELTYTWSKVYSPPAVRLNSGFSTTFDLSMEMPELMASMTKKHRYYVKKALDDTEKVVWRSGTDSQMIKDFVNLQESVIRRKNLKIRALSQTFVEGIATGYGQNCIIFTGYLDQVPVSTCLVLRFMNTAFYYSAATNETGRELNASYAMIYRLFQHLKQQNIVSFDFGGLNPKSTSSGVDHFKKGFGGKLTEYLGEWEWTSAFWLKYMINFAILFHGK